MLKAFKNDCKQLSTLIEERYNLSSIEVLFWIYFNIFFYNETCMMVTTYDKKLFLQKLEKHQIFHPYTKKYEMLDEEFYTQLYRTILKKYYCDDVKISIQGLEEIYESIIQQQLRLKTGSYYTPEAISKYMTMNSILTYVDNKIDHKNIKLENYILKRTDGFPLDYILQAISIIEEIRIIDIACGSGAFLRKTLHTLYNIISTLYQLIGRSICHKELIKQIIEKNIFGTDIQKTTGDMCKLLILMEAQILAEGPIGEVKLNVLHEDALKLEFDETAGFEKSFHIVIGNPPYIGERGNKALFDDIKGYEFGNKYYERKMDYFYFFIYKGYELLEERGLLCYITTNYFVTADGAKNLRCFLKNNFSFQTIINFNTLNLFPDAKGQHNMIFSLEKTTVEKPITLINFQGEKFSKESLYQLLMHPKSIPGLKRTEVAKGEIFNDQGHIFIQNYQGKMGVLNKIDKIANYRLDDLCYVNQGIVSGADRLTANWGAKLGIEEKIGAGIFVLNEEELEKLSLEEEVKENYCKAFYKNSYIKKYHTLENKGLYIVYIDNENLGDIGSYPNLYKHFYQYKVLLGERREVKNGVRKWYALQWPRKAEIFEGEKIVVPQRSLENTFAYIQGPWYASADVYYITKRHVNTSLLYLLGILNSSLMYFWLYLKGKRKGQQLELYATPLKGVPIYYPDNSEQLKALENLVEDMMRNYQNKEICEKIQSKIDKLVFKLYKLKYQEETEIVDFIKKQKR
ncbi:adenine-specific DNA-methyltransferase [Natronincola peptidivorans]|uniref:site-specific DNA-methyltransferase (adenine-specific) n=1 Tax=Natronincola peptidivorans TaxID=426128 RepID=A0A1I0EA64_9FIRM|nr:N-6 DNA methylase [Natronincola peptidivorans]SET42107.1 adenine-specific DNA-methyltransferase [Natronincola peptidivorans]